MGGEPSTVLRALGDSRETAEELPRGPWQASLPSESLLTGTWQVSLLSVSLLGSSFMLRESELFPGLYCCHGELLWFASNGERPIKEQGGFY